MTPTNIPYPNSSKYHGGAALRTFASGMLPHVGMFLRNANTTSLQWHMHNCPAPMILLLNTNSTDSPFSRVLQSASVFVTGFSLVANRPTSQNAPLMHRRPQAQAAG